MRATAIQFAVLNFGFAESYLLGSLVLGNIGKSFPSVDDAMDSLANDLLAMYKEDNHLNDPIKECCATNADKKYCPDCGSPITDQKIYAADFENWLIGLMTANLDDVGFLADDVQERNIVWELGYAGEVLLGKSHKSVLVIAERAEKKLSEFLGLE